MQVECKEGVQGGTVLACIRALSQQRNFLWAWVEGRGASDAACVIAMACKMLGAACYVTLVSGRLSFCYLSCILRNAADMLLLLSRLREEVGVSDRQLIKSFYDHGNKEQAKKMSAYMKDNFLYLGIPKPQRTELQKEFFKQAKKQKKVDWDFVFMLWDLPEREYQYLAVDYLLALKDSLQKSDIDRIKLLIINKSWWDSVDSLATTITGVLCAKYPELVQGHVLRWAESDNIWLVRVAILFQLKYKETTDTELLKLIISENSNTKEFFITKAIGWALREYSKTNKGWVKLFLECNTLQPLSVREASKYL